MIRKQTWVQLGLFAVVGAVTTTYGAVNLLHADEWLEPPYEVEVIFADAGGIYPHADVTLLGTPVGSVRDVEIGPGSSTTVVLALDHDAQVPTDVTAKVANASAIGEQYVELTPQDDDGPYLKAGSVIPVQDTSSPVDVASLLGNLDALAGSIDTKKLDVALTEMRDAATGLGPTLGRLIDDADRVSARAVTDVDDIVSLIDNAQQVLDTQVDLAPQTTAWIENLAELTPSIEQLVPDLTAVMTHGVRAGVEVTELLSATQQTLPLLLTSVLDVTDVAATRTQGLRKSLTLLPWALEIGASATRPCAEYNSRTGEPIESTCRYDENGEPIYTTFLALQLPELPGAAPYQPCTRGYEGTERYLANGRSLTGGKTQQAGSPANPEAHCAAAPTDKLSPNVRGAQNSRGKPPVDSGARARTGRLETDRRITPEGTYVLEGAHKAPPQGDDGLVWLLSQPLQ